MQLTAKLADYFNLDKEYHLAELNQLTTEASTTRQELLNTLERSQKERQELVFVLRQQAADGTLAQLYQEQAGLEEELVNLGHQWLDNRLSMTVLQDVLAVLATQQLPALLSVASAFFNKLTEGVYQTCLLRDDQLVVRQESGDSYSLNQLSTGTRDQLYLAIRLAFIQLHSQEQLAPVIIDDGWLHYDTQRKVALFNLLTSMSQEVQVICFTSDLELKHYVEQSQFNCQVL